MEFANAANLPFLAGAAIPIIIHLLNRQRFRRVRWGAMQFLLNAVKKTRRRLMIEDLLLLLIRIIIMILLALAIARPFFRESPLAGLESSNTNYIFVIDNSYSMGYKRAQATSLDLAKKAAEKLIDEIRFTSNDKFTRVLMSQYPDGKLRNLVKRDKIKSAISEIELSDFGTSAYNTFQVIADVVSKSENIDKKIYIFTDMQRNAWDTKNDEEHRKFVELLKKVSKDPHVRCYIIDVGDPDPVNTGIIQVLSKDRVVTTKNRANFAVTLYNYSSIGVRDLPVSLWVNGDKKDTKHVTIDPHSTYQVSFDYDFMERGPYYIKIETTPDFLARDDARYFVADVKDNIKLLLIDGEPGPGLQSETKMLELILDPMGEGLFFSVEVRTPDSLPAEDLDRFDGIVMANVQYLPTDKVERLKEFVKNGGGLFIALGGKCNLDFYNKDLYEEGRGLMPAQLVEVLGAEKEKVRRLEEPEVLLTRIRFDHPMFRTFQKEKLRPVLFKIPFAQYWKVEKYDPDQVLAGYADAAELPAFIEKPYGEGKVMLHTSTIDDEWSLLPNRHVPFCAIMHDLMHYLASRPMTNKNIFVGESAYVRLTMDKRSESYRLTHVDPGRAGALTVSPEPYDAKAKYLEIWIPGRLPKDVKELEARNEVFKYAGVYSLTRSDAPQQEGALSYFAVNVGPRDASAAEIYASEGNLERMSEEELKTRFPDFQVEFIGKKAAGKADVPISAGSSLARAFLYALLGFLLLESILACLFGRNKE